MGGGGEGGLSKGPPYGGQKNIRMLTIYIKNVYTNWSMDFLGFWGQPGASNPGGPKLGWGGASIGPALDQHWTSIGPVLRTLPCPALGQYWASLLLGCTGSGQAPQSLRETGMAWFAQFCTPGHQPRLHLAQAYAFAYSNLHPHHTSQVYEILTPFCRLNFRHGWHSVAP